MIVLFFSKSEGHDLVDVYNQSVTFNPTLKKSYSQWMSARQDFPLAIVGNGLTGSGFLPYIKFKSLFSRAHMNETVSDLFGGKGYFTGYDHELTVTQQVFNAALIEKIKSANYKVKSATYLYIYAEQKLMLNVCIAYFQVLKSYQLLSVSIELKKAYLRNLKQVLAMHKAGFASLADVYNAKVSYTDAVSQEIIVHKELYDSLENLQKISGIGYEQLKIIKDNIPLLMPKPNNVNLWKKTAIRNNNLLKSDQYMVIDQKHQIKQAAYNNFPTVNLVGTYENIKTGTSGFDNLLIEKEKSRSVEIEIDFPILNGGYTYFNTKQKQYTYLSAIDQYHIDYEDVMTSIEKSFIDIFHDIKKLKIDIALIQYAEKQIIATKAAYKIGTRTMFDVVSAYREFDTIKVDNINTKYNYVFNSIILKFNLGVLSPEDIAYWNSWLKDEITIPSVDEL